LISASFVTELAIGWVCLVFPLGRWAEGAEPPSRLRFSLIHEAVPRYYEMFGITRAGGPSAGNPLLPSIEEPEAFLIESVDERHLFSPQSPWRSAPRGEPGRRPATYSLSDNWTAQLSYQHSVIAQTLSNSELRTKKLTEFSTDRERDVLGLQMDWRLAGSTVGLGYRFQSMRGEPGSGISGIGERFMHSFTLGFTREWGAAKPFEP
jgi:hypothetical protein